MARIAITCGDPTGIGPEIVLKAVASGQVHSECIILGPKRTIESTARKLSVREFSMEPCGEDAPKPSEASGRAALAAIDRAVELVDSGACQAMVTAPVAKNLIAKTGIPFRGHTEYLAAKAGVKETTMAFFSDALKVSLVTTHVPLKKVPSVLTRERIVRAIRRTSDALKTYFNVARPKLAVAALNPHAGEEGLFGREEIDVIAPAVQQARKAGIDCEGPLAADSIFRRAGFDAFISMYHDHGLTVVKTVAPGASNVTLGLPYVRTSPDHGTGFDIAGKMVADATPMIEALKLAERMLAAEKEPRLL
jgi:4-hydroxythreonine-4-phosphate dehydrogenase